MTYGAIANISHLAELIPANAGIHKNAKIIDSRFRGNDK